MKKMYFCLSLYDIKCILNCIYLLGKITYLKIIDVTLLITVIIIF